MYNKESLTYSDVEKKLELDIFGIKYDLDITDKMLEKWKNLENSEKEDLELSKEAIDLILGEGQFDLLKSKYETDTKKEFGTIVATKIMFYIAGRIEEFYSNENKAIEKYSKYQNREFRRNNRRNNYRRY